MNYILVVFPKEEVLFTPYKEGHFHLYVAQDPNGSPRFIWIDGAGEVDIPSGIALRAGWRPATAADEADINVSTPRILEYTPNQVSRLKRFFNR